MSFVSDERLLVALRLMLHLIQRFDSGGESERSVRARLLSLARRLLETDSEMKIEAVDPTDVHELVECLVELSEVQVSLKWSESKLDVLSDEEFAYLLLYEQHQLMDEENDPFRYSLSLGIQRALSVPTIAEQMCQSGFDQYSDYELWSQAVDRLYSDGPVFD